jgi:hypothetical protein
VGAFSGLVRRVDRWVAIADLRVALVPFLAGRIATFLVVVFTVWGTIEGDTRPHLQELEAPFRSWDGENYSAIAEHGYPAGRLDLTPGHAGHLWGFFPGYPILMRAAAPLLHDVVLSGMAVSAAAELAALYFLVRLVTLERDRESARYSAWLLALFPYAVFLSMVYTESAFLAAAAASLYHMRRGNHTSACLAAGVAGAIRITGLALVLPLAIEYLGRRRWRPGPGLLWIVVSVLPLGAFLLYAYHQTGDPLAYQHAQGSASYGRALAWPWLGALKTFQQATGDPASFAFLEALELVAGVLGLVVVIAMFLVSRFPRSLAVYAAGVWLLPVSLDYWFGIPRYSMALLPATILIADATRGRPEWRTAILAVSAVLMGYGSAVLATGRYLG